MTRLTFSSDLPRTAVSVIAVRGVPSFARGTACLTAAVAAALAVGAAPTVAEAASTMRSEPGQFIAISAEAEDALVSDERWVLTVADTPQTAVDPDGNHSDGAGGGAYVELLPDNRVTRDDENFPPGTPSYGWSNGGDGPRMDWTIDFPEAGRWFVHARAYHTGSEDNGIHVGLNDAWPASGKQMQWCAPNKWHWSSQQRGTVDRHCGLGERTIWLDVPSAGEHTVSFSAREDGFELDRFMLIKDLSGGTRECLPTGVDDIDCGDGVIEAIDGFVDIGVELDLEQVGDTSERQHRLTASVGNEDGRDAASLVTLDLVLGDGWRVVDADERCTTDIDSPSCALGDLMPGAATDVALLLEATRSGTLTIDAAVGSNESDDNADNDSADVDSEIAPAAALEARLDAGTDPRTTDQPYPVRITVSNGGDDTARDLRAALSVPTSMDVVSAPETCTTERPFECRIDALAPDETVELEIELQSALPGTVVLQLEVSGAEIDNTSASATVRTVSPTAVDSPAQPVEGKASDGGESAETGGGAPAALLLILLGAAARRLRQSNPPGSVGGCNPMTRPSVRATAGPSCSAVIG